MNTSKYLAHSAGMFHGQATAGHRCSHIAFQIHHNSSHCVQASRTIFLAIRKEENKINKRRRQTQTFSKTMGLSENFAKEKEAKKDETLKF